MHSTLLFFKHKKKYLKKNTKLLHKQRTFHTFATQNKQGLVA